MNLNTRVPCPACGSKRNKQIPGHRLECNKCGAQRDVNNEGIVAVHTNPKRNAEILEREEQRKR